MSQINIGMVLPSALLYEDLPENVVNIRELIERKRAIIFGVPGAFVPGCSKVHLTGFIQKSSELKSLGYHEIICVSVNDPFVMSAWGWSKGAEGKVRMLADPQGTYTKKIGMSINMPELGGLRSRRYSMITINGIVRELYVDSSYNSLTCLR